MNQLGRNDRAGAVRSTGAAALRLILAGAVAAGIVGMGAQCAPTGASSGGASGIYSNATDRTNGGASYIGSQACAACHADFAGMHGGTGHASALRPILGGAPDYPTLANRAGIPNPPEGFAWSDIAYVVGGFTKHALFVDLDGFLLTTGQTGTATGWSLALPAHGSSERFEAYLPSASTPPGFDFECFRCHATGAAASDLLMPVFQENRLGMAGRFEEAGVGCEACHGPGSNHVVNPRARKMFVDPRGRHTCNECHARPFGSGGGEIQAENFYILNNAQVNELAASGGHSAFACTICHDPHRSLAYDREAAIRNECTACHGEQNMAFHSGKVFQRGDYEEPLSCASCHMPYASRCGPVAPSEIVGDLARVGDTRTHIFRIDPDFDGFPAMFNGDGTRVRVDENGLAGVTADFVCLRCHNGNGAFSLGAEIAADIALRMHEEEERFGAGDESGRRNK